MYVLMSFYSLGMLHSGLHNRAHEINLPETCLMTPIISQKVSSWHVFNFQIEIAVKVNMRLTTIIFALTSSFQSHGAVINGILSISLDQNGPLSQAYPNSVLYWLQSISVGITKLASRYPDSHLIGINSFILRPDQATSPAQLDRHRVLNDHPLQSTVIIDGIGVGPIDWEEPELQGRPYVP